MIDAHLYTFLAAQATITAITGTRIYPTILPEDPEFEAITFREAGDDIDNVHGGSTGFARADYFIDAWARNKTDADTLAKIIRDAIKNHSGTFGGITVNEIFITIGPMTAFEHTVEAYRVTQMFSIWHGEV